MKRRLQNVLIACFTLIFFLYRGDAKKNIHPKSFVVIQPTGNLGDMVCTTPVFEAIKKRYPGALVTVVGSQKNSTLLEHSPYIDAYIVFSGSVWDLVKKMKKQQFDGGIVINPDALHVGALFLAGVQSISCFRLSLAYAHRESTVYAYMTNFVHTTEYVPGSYVPDQYLKLLSYFDIYAQSIQKKLFVSEGSIARVREIMRSAGIDPDKKCVAVAPGAGADYKRWSPERFAEIVCTLYTMYGIPTILIGGSQDAHTIQEMVQYIKPGVLYWSPGPQSFDDLKSTLAQASIVIGNDSGAIHVAEALGVMTVTIAGPTDVGEHMQEDNRHRIIQGEISEKPYQSYIGDESRIERDQAHKQMESVSTNSVMEELKKLMQYI